VALTLKMPAMRSAVMGEIPTGHEQAARERDETQQGNQYTGFLHSCLKMKALRSFEHQELITQ
jgi:hypothetical protein